MRTSDSTSTKSKTHSVYMRLYITDYRLEAVADPEGGGGVRGFNPPPPLQRLFFVFFACQYMKGIYMRGYQEWGGGKQEAGS